MAESGLTDTARHVDALQSEQEARAAVHGLMQHDSRPTALFTSHYEITLGAIRALHDLQLEHCIALIGFDDIILADLVRPAITVMAQDPSQLGTLAAERLFARLDGDTSPVQTVVVAAKLVVRGSGEIPPAHR